MESEDRYRRQYEFLSQVPAGDVSLISVFLLGVCHARTNVDCQTLYPFFQDAENSLHQRWITPEERLKVDQQLYIGALGQARELLTEFKQLELEGQQRAIGCSLCHEPLPMESVFTPSAECGHTSHLKCAQEVVRSVMLQGDSPTLHCPSDHCEAKLSESDLGRLFTPADYEILCRFWAKPSSDQQSVPVVCPSFTCRASTIWRRGQFFECQACRIRFCLRCLWWQPREQQGHECGPCSSEHYAIGELFAKGNRFKVCGNCGYWCDLTGVKTATCRCGRDICARCFLFKKECECDMSLLDKIITLPEKFLKQL